MAIIMFRESSIKTPIIQIKRENNLKSHNVYSYVFREKHSPIIGIPQWRKWCPNEWAWLILCEMNWGNDYGNFLLKSTTQRLI